MKKKGLCFSLVLLFASFFIFNTKAFAAEEIPDGYNILRYDIKLKPYQSKSITIYVEAGENFYPVINFYNSNNSRSYILFTVQGIRDGNEVYYKHQDLMPGRSPELTILGYKTTLPILYKVTLKNFGNREEILSRSNISISYIPRDASLQ